MNALAACVALRASPPTRCAACSRCSASSSAWRRHHHDRHRHGAQQRVAEQIKSLGSNIMLVLPGTLTAAACAWARRPARR
jgi:hypothetical protein